MFGPRHGEATRVFEEELEGDSPETMRIEIDTKVITLIDSIVINDQVLGVILWKNITLHKRVYIRVNHTKPITKW